MTSKPRVYVLGSDCRESVHNFSRGSQSFVSGHDFSRADKANKMTRALAPAQARLLESRFLRRLKPLLPKLLAFFTISFATSLPAQSPSPHALAQRIDSRYNHLHALRAAFTETYNGLGIRRSESGTLTLLKPGRMRWDYSSPAGKIFLLDGKFAWFYARGDAQVQRIPSSAFSSATPNLKRNSSTSALPPRPMASSPSPASPKVRTTSPTSAYPAWR